MFASQFRLRKKTEVDIVFRRGRSVAAPEFIFRFIPNSLEYSRVAILVGKKLAQKATERNRIRRRLREIARNHFDQIPSGLDLLVIARDAKIREMDFAELTQKFLTLATKIH